MNSDLPASASAPTLSQAETQSKTSHSRTSPSETAGGETTVPQVRFQGEEGRLLLLLPPEADSSGVGLTWNDLWLQFKNRLQGGERFWQPHTPVHLIVRDRLLDGRQLQDIANALTEAKLELKRVYTSRRQTAVVAATAGFSVEQQAAVDSLKRSQEVGQALAEPLYIQTTLRSGVEIRHPGTVIVLGDVNPGSSIVAEGDVMVWGALRGVVQAGASGNTRCMIMALRMEPTQVRIADFVARAPSTPPAYSYPEVAYVATDGIRIAKAAEFSRDRLLP